MKTMESETSLFGQRLADLGETEALRLILPLLKQGSNVIIGPGDDSAVIENPKGKLLLSTDMMLEGADFRLDWSSHRDLGFKSVATNAADIAAMGGVVLGYEIALAVPPSTLLGSLRDFAFGFLEGISLFSPGASVLGGDLSRSPTFTIVVTVLGSMMGRAAVSRGGAQHGDLVCVAGELGVSKRGFRKLVEAGENEDQIRDLVQFDKEVIYHLRPKPPLEMGPLAQQAGATAMTDISDGLIHDALNIAQQSGVQLHFDKGVGLDHDSLYGGEDHGLLATFPPSCEIPDGFRTIGTVILGEPGVFLGSENLGTQKLGWDPFTN